MIALTKLGRPVIRVAKDITDNVRLVRENFVAGLQSYANKVITENTEAYKKQVKLCQEAAKPILSHDKAMLDEAMAKAVQQAIAESEAREAKEEAKAVKEAEAIAKGEGHDKELVPA